MTATDRYCQMWAAWRQTVSKKLAAENPRVLSEYLRLASQKAGITRSELQRELGLKQPRESKLSTKLREKKWLKVVKKRRGKVLVEFLQATSLAKSSMKKLEVSLRVLSPPPPVASSARSKGGRLGTPPNAVGSLLDLVSQNIPRRMMP